MKRLILFGSIFFSLLSEAQNLVPNWSFEDTLPNPTWTGFIPLDCALWQSPPPGNAKYQNDFDPFFPGNASLYQVPHTGAAWALLYTNDSRDSTGNYQNGRDIVEVQLNDTLAAGKRYCVSFYVSRFDYCNYACNNFGALLAPSPIANSNSIVTIQPTIYNDPIANPLLSDSTWIEISGSFIANGGEDYIIIGNFNDDSTSDTVFTGVAQPGNNFAMYMLDDVSVIRCDNSTVTTEDNFYIPNAFSPNNDGNNDFLFVRGKNIVELNFAVYDRWGEKVFETQNVNEGWDGTFNGEKMENAVFVYYARGTYSDGKPFASQGNVSLIR